MTSRLGLDISSSTLTPQQKHALLDLTPLPENVDFKVLFMYPNIRFESYPIERSVMPHLGIAVLSSCCRQIGTKTSLCDLTTVPASLWNDLFRARLKKEKPNLVAFTATSMQWPYTAQLVKICMQLGIPHVVGGAHPTEHTESTIEEADVLVVGEGEGAMLDIVRALAGGQPLAGIANTWVRTEGGQVVKTDRRHLIEDLDAIPFPDWKLFHLIHHRFTFMTERMASTRSPKPVTRAVIEGSRGCPFQCSYCSSASHMKAYKGKGTWRREKSPRRLIEELKAFREVYGGVDRVHWVDEIFMTSTKRLTEFCELYKREIGVPFSIKERPENITEPKVKILAEAGLSMISIGLESGDERFRQEVLNRKASNDTLKRAFRLPRKYGVKTHSFTMVGLPGQGIDSMLLTWRFLRRIKPDSAQFTIFRPMRGTALYDECIKRGMYDPIHDTEPWILSPIIKHDLLDDNTIVRYGKLLDTYVTQRGIWPAIAFHFGRQSDWTCRLLLRSKGRWCMNKAAGLAGIRNVLDVIKYEVQELVNHEPRSPVNVMVAIE